MRSLITCLVPFLLVACSGGTTHDATAANNTGGGGNAPSGAGGSGANNGSSGTNGAGNTGSTGAGGADDPTGPITLPNDDFSDEDATVDDALNPTITEPIQLVPEGSLVDITADDRLVYRASQGLWTVKAAPGAPPRKAALVSGNVHVRGRTVFNFANVDWQTDQGTLTFWTPGVGRRSVGPAMIGDSRVAARNDDAYVLFARNVQVDTLDIVVSSADAKQAYALVVGAGRGNDDTCSPSFGFAGPAVVASWCEVGTTQAKLARFNLSQGGKWTKEVISDNAQGRWSSDATGEHLFYLTLDGRALVLDAAGTTSISDGVGWGMIHPQGDVVFFTVGDQLRRSDLTSAPVPVVVDGFQQAVAWNADLSLVLYSSAVVYDTGKQQDLRATPTAWFNPLPTVLVDQPVATIGRSALTTDGNYALYSTDTTNQGGTLHLRSIAADGGVTVGDVDTVLAAAGSVVVFTDNRTAPGIFPALVDMKVVDASTALPPHLLEVGIEDGRGIQLTADKTRVAYRRTGGVGVGGLWLRTIE